MTIQFGLVGTDGIALVSDTRITDQTHTTRTNSDACKINLNQRGTVATAWALKDTGLVVEKAIRREMGDDSQNPAQALEDIAERVWDKVADKSPSQLLVVITKTNFTIV